MRDYDVFTVESKADVLEKSREYWNPGKTGFWVDTGVDLVIDRREGYYIWDMSGARLIDVHLNGGTFNLGHRNAELVEAMKFFASRMKIVVEPTGCLGAAAVLANRLDVRGKRVGIVLSGGNVDLARFASLVSATSPGSS